MAQLKTGFEMEGSTGPASATDVPHQYEDKFAAAEFLTNTAIAAEQVGAFPSIRTKHGGQMFLPHFFLRLICI